MNSWILEDITPQRFKFVAWIGVLGHPFYYLYWRIFYPEYEDSAFLRLGTALVFLALLFHSHWPNFLKGYKNHLWHCGLILALPTIFTFTLIANNYMGIWLATHVGMMLLLLACVQQSKSYFLMLFSGTGMGILWFSVTIGGDIFNHFPLEYIPLFLFLNFVGMAFSYLTKHNLIASQLLLEREQQKVIQERQKSLTMKMLAGSIAHEMRNPLSQIHWSLHFIARQATVIDEQLLEYLNDANKIAKSGLQVIDITMDAINEKPINKENFTVISANDIVAETLNQYAYSDAEHANKLSYEGYDFELIADPVTLKYVLYNLIGNALYFVKTLSDANIVISLIPEKRQIVVRDTGPGIAKSAIPKLFDSFYTASKQGGTGLGLSYCKRTMTELGGDIHCQSELGEYTSFILSFPDVINAKDAIKNVA